MSLVDYGSSDEEEDREQPEMKPQELQQPREQNALAVEEGRNHLEAATMDQLPAPKLDAPRPQNSTNQRFRSTVNRQGEETSKKADPPALVLPDASLLLNSPAVPSHLAHATDHSSRVAAAMAESESRKRDLNGTPSSSYPRSKIPRGKLPHSKSIPETVGGHLLPPQLIGRSNIVTEDLSKLFVKKHAASSPQ